MSSDGFGIAGVSEALAADDREQVHLGSELFDAVGQFVSARRDFPSGHPGPVRHLRSALETLHSLLKLNDETTVVVDQDEIRLHGPGKTIWSGDEAASFAEPISRDGVAFLTFSPGVEFVEFHRLFDGLFRLVEEDEEAPNVRLDLTFEHISVGAADASAVTLAGTPYEFDAPVDDEEKRATQKLFDRSFPSGRSTSTDGPSALEVVIGTADDHERTGFAGIEESTAERLRHLAADFTDSKRCEFRHLEILVGLLVDAPTGSSAAVAAEHLAADIGMLLDNDRYRDARQAVRLVGKRRSDLSPRVGTRLVDALDNSITDARMRRMQELVAYGPSRVRKDILRFIHKLASQRATRSIVDVLKWQLDEPVLEHLFQFIGRRSGAEFEMLLELGDKITTANARRLVLAASESMPDTQGFLLKLLGRRVGPTVKALILEKLRGHLTPEEADSRVVPLLDSSDGQLTVAAVETIVEVSPERVPELLHPLIRDRLDTYDDRTRSALVVHYANHGGREAAESLKEIIRVKKLSDDTQKSLSVVVARAASNTSNPEVIAMLENVADDWMVAKAVRNACSEAVAASQFPE